MRSSTVNVSCFSGFSDFHFVWLAIYFAPFSVSRSLSVSASDLISRLVRGEVCRSEQIQSHPFFKGVNWNEVSCNNFRALSPRALWSAGRRQKWSPAYQKARGPWTRDCMSTLDLHLYAKPMTQPEVLALVSKGFFVTFNRWLCDHFEKPAVSSVASRLIVSLKWRVFTHENYLDAQWI